MNSCSAPCCHRTRYSPTRRHCRYLIRAEGKRKLGSFGATQWTIGPGPDLRIRPWPMSTAMVAMVNTRSRIWRHSGASCRSMAMPGMASWSKRARMGRSSWRSVGCTRGDCSMSSIPPPSHRLAAEVLARIAKLYEIEAEVRGQPADVRRAIRQERSRPLVEDLQRWLQEHLPRLPGWSDLAKAMRYALAHWDGLILSLDDGRLEMDTNTVERAIRPITITRKNSLFAGSDAGARRWAIANTLIQSCKLNGVEPLAYLTDVLQRIVSGQTRNNQLHTLVVGADPLPTHYCRGTATNVA